MKNAAESRPFLGCVILESLLDEGPLAGLVPILERVSAVPDDPDATTWHTRWYLVDGPDLEERLPALAAAMRRNWYGHFWRGDDLRVILPGKIFQASASDRGTWAELIAYGEGVGVGRRWTESIPTVPPAYVAAALGGRG